MSSLRGTRGTWWIAAVVASAAGCGSSADVVPGTCLAVSASGEVYDPGAPGELPTGFVSRAAVAAHSFMVVANHPVAARAGCDILAAGGSAVDAAIAVQLVLNLVEPQSSGIGGGAFLVSYDASTHRVASYDGRETAPAAATESYLRWISDAQPTPPLPDARASGRSIGTPGVMRLLEAAHQDAGKLAWRDLFAPAIRIAGDGFAISPSLAQAIAGAAGALVRDPDARDYFLDGGGHPRPAGARLSSPAFAATLQQLADGGAAAFYAGPIADDIVAKIGDTTGGITPGATTLADLAGYQAVRRDAVCGGYRTYQVCGMGPPSSGGIAIAQILGILAQFDLAADAPVAPDRDGGRPAVAGVHLVTEAERLAYADRDAYVADSDVVALPGGSPAALIDPAYLARRAQLIDPARSLGTAAPGDFGLTVGVAAAQPEHGTSQITVVDAVGNAVAMTTSIEAELGSFHMTRSGFLLNNQLTDFSAEPADPQGRPIANRVGPGKRPRSSMAPTLVLDPAGALVLATGSPGGAAIIQYVAKALVGMLDWRLDAQQATALIDFGAANTPITNVGGEHPDVDGRDGGARDPLVSGLRALGHTVNLAPLVSGLGAIVVRRGAAGAYDEGGADPRREGVVLGDTFRP